MTMEAEQNLLGMAMLDTNSAIKLLEIPEDWFSINSHKLIYRAISSLTAQSLTVDSIELGNSLFAKSDNIDGLDMEYLVDLESQTTKLSHFDGYKNALFKSYKTSQMQAIATTLQRRINNSEDFGETCTYLQDSIFEVLTDHNTTKPEPINHYMKQVIDDLAYQHANPDKTMGKQTGFTELDETINGFEEGKVYVIGGRPGMGKTQFALNIGMRISKETDTLIFSLEMTGAALAKRALSNISNTDGKKINGATMTQDEWEGVIKGAAIIKDQNKIFIDETSNLGTNQIRARLKAHEIKFGKVGCIIVDHIGLVQKNSKKNEREALTQISHELQSIAKQFKCPLIELVQLNRGVEERDDKRPVLKDIKETSAIEEDARVIMFPFRDEYYTKEKSQMKGITELVIAKNSDGETKSIFFKSDMACARYESFEGYTRPEPEKKQKGKF